MVYAHVEAVPTPGVHPEGAALSTPTHNHHPYGQGDAYGYPEDCPDQVGHTVGEYVTVDLPLAVAVAVPK